VRSNADFRWLWGGQIVSLLGDWFNTIASVALIASLTSSGPAVGGLFVVRMLAPFLTSPLAGVLADRYSRRNILIVSDLVRGCIVLGMLVVRSSELVWLLYVLTALQLGTSSFFFTARTAILPDIVERHALGAANAITSATWSVMLAVGAALGGFTAGWLGPHAAFAIDAATFFVSALLVAQISGNVCSKKPHDSTTLAGTMRQYWDGIRYLAGHPDIMVIALHKTALTVMFGTTFRVVQAAVADRVFPLGEEGGIAMGLMFGAAGIGTGIGPLAVRHFLGDGPRRLRWAIAAGYVVGGAGLIVSAQLLSLPMMLLGAVLTGIGNGLLWVFSSQLLLQMVDEQVRGRVFGTEFAMFTLASAAGSATVGVAMDSALGLSGVMLVMAALSLAPLTGWVLWLVFGKHTRRTDGQLGPSGSEKSLRGSS
jgi:MFS family permease